MHDVAYVEVRGLPSGSDFLLLPCRSWVIGFGWPKPVETSFWPTDNKILNELSEDLRTLYWETLLLAKHKY